MNQRRALLIGLGVLALVAAPAVLFARADSARHKAERARASLGFVLDGAARLVPLAGAAPESAPAGASISLGEGVQSCIVAAGLDASLVRDLSKDAHGVRTTLSPLTVPQVGALLVELRRAGFRVLGLELTGISRSDQFTLSLSLGARPAR